MTSITTLSSVLPAPTIASLGECATLVSVEVRLPSFTKADKRVTGEVADREKADVKAVSVNKSLMAGAPTYTALSNYRTTIKGWTNKFTFDWAGNLRLLPGVRRPQFLEEFYEIHTPQWHVLENKFYDAYADAITAQAFVQGSMFRREDYPDLEELRSSGRISLRLYEQEVPAGDFRNTIGVESAQDALHSYQVNASRFITEMAERQVADYAKVIDSLVKACSVETKIDGKGKVKVSKGRLYEATFKRALEYADMLDTMNLANDPRLSMLKDEIRRILDMPYETLSESDTKRTTVREELADLRKKFSFDESVASDNEEAGE